MDDQLNNNLEDFLNSSMERFDDVPSSQVWDKIDKRLVEDKKKPNFITWKFLLPIFLITVSVLSISLFLFKNNNEINIIQDQLSQIENQNIESLEKKTPVVAIENNDDIQLNNTISQNTSNTKTPIENNGKNTIEEKVSPLDTQEKRANVSNSSSSQKRTPTVEKKIFNNKSKEKQTQNSSSFSKIIPASIDYTNFSNTTPNPPITFVEKPNSSTPLIKKNIVENNPFNPLFKIASPQIISPLEVKDYLLFISQRDIGNLAFTEPIMASKSDHSLFHHYRFGLNARFANTFIKHNTDFNGTESYGFRHEYILNPKWAITNSINFNVQHYDITTSSGILEKAVVREYTDRDFNDIGVTEIDVNSEYIDIPLGIKWNYKVSPTGWSYFLNPSAVWQVYLPQMFSFIQTDNNVIVRNDSRIVASLGSANLGLGMEKKIGDHLYFQCSLWGEYSFIPLGTQKDKIKLIGVRTSLLFGK